MADDVLILLNISGKIRLDISSESSAEQTIHMKCQVLFSLNNNNNNQNVVCCICDLRL